jgi:hypothetical protein
LTFVTVPTVISKANVKSKTPLERSICRRSFDSNMRKKGGLKGGMRMPKSASSMRQTLPDGAGGEELHIFGNLVARGWQDSRAKGGHFQGNCAFFVELAAKKTQPDCRNAGQASKRWNCSQVER